MRCHYRTFNTRNIRETILTALHLVHTFHLFSRYVFTLLTKMWTGTKTVPSTWYIFNVQGCSHTDFHICALYCYWLTWRIGEFLREKRSVAFLTGHLFTFLVVLILICLVTTQILICENQTTWRLEILLRTIVAALLKTKCNGRFVMNKRYQKAGKEYFRRVQMIVKDEGYKYFPARATFDAWSCPPSPPSVPQTRHTHQQKGHFLPDDLCPSHLQPTQPYFQFPSRQMHKFSYHTTAQKGKKIYSLSLENSHKLYLYSTSPRYQYKLKPQHEWADSKSSLIYQENLFNVEVFFHLFVF